MNSVFSYSIRHLLVATALTALVLLAATHLSMSVVVACVVLWSVTAAIPQWRNLEKRCWRGAAGGMASVVAITLTWTALAIVGSFYHQEPWPYWEDGFYTEVFFYPLAGMLIYGCFGAMLGSLTVGLLVPALLRAVAMSYRLTRLAGDKRTFFTYSPAHYVELKNEYLTHEANE